MIHELCFFLQETHTDTEQPQSQAMTVSPPSDKSASPIRSPIVRRSNVSRIQYSEIGLRKARYRILQDEHKLRMEILNYELETKRRVREMKEHLFRKLIEEKSSSVDVMELALSD